MAADQDERRIDGLRHGHVPSPAYGALYWATAATQMSGPVVVDARHVVEVDAARAAPLTVVAKGRPLTPDRG
jgi:hypothetical protein